MAEAVPWAAWLAHANAALAIPPAMFWRLTLREWRALAGAPAPAALRRNEFEALARAYPDR